ncbi:DSD1 family PLP-dependent enzyme [Alteromonas sediminis]|uniref:DSD1 family PLP-dependent enzyme n=1 Tax=Alteromonas sediminis TaxID=2259342 RepID=A0A3N5Y0K9_9ALTE|nr:alanine racemase [Alteromonas sediminis]RPJ66640.1 DSD1 family PLP-dependent enzyme [Alteromonas sediminis]
MLSLSNLPTPACLIDKVKMQNNIARLSTHIGSLGCRIRPHVKTHKSVEITQAIFEGGNASGITVSTLKEAKHFFAHGYKDVLYAVGIVPSKLEDVAQLLNQGCHLTIILDSVDMATRVVDSASAFGCIFPVMIELDTDGHRSGADPQGQEIINIANVLHQSEHTELKGVMTHAGESYNCFSHEEQRTIARQERDLSILAANRIRQQGIECAEVSIGSTPTAFAIDDLTGITEVRAGVYVLFDLVMAGLQVCKNENIAMSVLASVIGHQQHKDWVITDAGWMAMSRDRGTASHPVDQGYGLVCTVEGKVKADFIIADANQEHGILQHRNGSSETAISSFPLASKLRILPNHACSTAAQYDHFFLVENDTVLAELSTISGW